MSWLLCWPETTSASTVSIVSYSLVYNGTPRTRLLSQFDGEKHLLHEHHGSYAPDKSSAVHAHDHQTTALGPICYTLSYTRGHPGQYRMQSHDSCWILQQFHQQWLDCSHGFTAWSAVSLSQLHANWSPLRCSSLTFCLPFWNLSTQSYTLPWLIQLSPYWTFILL